MSINLNQNVCDLKRPTKIRFAPGSVRVKKLNYRNGYLYLAVQITYLALTKLLKIKSVHFRNSLHLSIYLFTLHPFVSDTNLQK